MPTTYRQLTQRIRVQRPGRPDLVSERPRETAGRRRFKDTDDAPTLITFEDDDQVDVARLLRIGAIAPWPAADAPAPVPRRRRAGKGGSDGEAAQ
jgi:hypothetical protein